MADTGMGITATVTSGLRTDLIDDTVMVNIHADQHNRANAAILALQGLSGGGGSGGITLIPPDPTVTPLVLQAAPGQTADLLDITDPIGQIITWIDCNGTLHISGLDGSSDLGFGSVMNRSMSGLLSTDNPILSTAWCGFGYFNTMTAAWTDPSQTGWGYVTGHNQDNGNVRFAIDNNGGLMWASYDVNGMVWGNPDVILQHRQSAANNYGTMGLSIMAGDWQPNVTVLSIVARGSTINNRPGGDWAPAFGPQTGDLLRIQDGETGNVWATFDATGALSLTPNDPYNVPFSIRAVLGQQQNANLLEIFDQFNQPLAFIEGDGSLVTNSSILIQNINTAESTYGIPFAIVDVIHTGNARLFWIDATGAINIGASGFPNSTAKMFMSPAALGAITVPSSQYFNFGENGGTIYGVNNDFSLHIGSAGGDIWFESANTVRFPGNMTTYWGIAMGDDPSPGGIFGPNPGGQALFMGQSNPNPHAPSWGMTLFVDSANDTILKAIDKNGVITQIAPAGAAGNLSPLVLTAHVPTERPLRLIGATGQTGDLMEAFNGAGSKLLWIDSTGALNLSTGTANPRFQIKPDGSMAWGTGTAALGTPTFQWYTDAGWGQSLQVPSGASLSISGNLLAVAGTTASPDATWMMSHLPNDGELLYQINMSGTQYFYNRAANGSATGSADVALIHTLNPGGVAGLVVQAYQSDVTPLTVQARQIGTQTLDLFRALDSTGNILLAVQANGGLSFNDSSVGGTPVAMTYYPATGNFGSFTFTAGPRLTAGQQTFSILPGYNGGNTTLLASQAFQGATQQLQFFGRGYQFLDGGGRTPLISNVPIQITSGAAPAVVAGSGSLYVAADGSLHYRGPTTDTVLAPA